MWSVIVPMRSYLIQVTSKITALARLGNLSLARQMFDEMPHRDTIAWNSMISGYSRMGFFQEALSLFKTMRLSNVKPDDFTYTAVLSVCGGGLHDIKSGQRLHVLVIISGWYSVPLGNALMDMYGKCSSSQGASKVFEEMGFRNEVSWCSLLFAYVNVGLLDISRTVFDNMPRRVVVAWNTIIAGYAKWGEGELCLEWFKKMLDESCRPDQWTLSAVMSACTQMSVQYYGYMLHSLAIETGLTSAAEVSNSVLSFYTKFGDKNEILNAIEAVGTFNEVSGNAVIDSYMKLGNLEEAYLVFHHLPDKNLVSWTSMIVGYMRNGEEECALRFFADLMRSGTEPDDVTFGSVLHTCSNIAAFSHGRMVHCQVVKSGFHGYSYVGNGLVNMYAKCGDIDCSTKSFHDILDKDIVSWNTMLFAYGLHGCSRQALLILDEMVAARMKPDKVTYIGLLMTCSHLGLIDEGLSYFGSMGSLYGVCPEIDHVAIVVDMLGRGGRLEKAKELASKYGKASMEVSSLETLLGWYSSQGDLSMGAQLAEQLQIVKPDDEMSYVLLSNLYCASGEWKQAQNLRKTMRDDGIKKVPGCSWIEGRDLVTSFVAGSNLLLCNEDMQTMLQMLESKTRYPICIPSALDSIHE